MPFAAADAIRLDPIGPMPMDYGGLGLRDLPAEAVDALLPAAGPDVEVPLVLAEVRHLGGAPARPAGVPNAVAGPEAAFSLWVLGPKSPPRRRRRGTLVPVGPRGGHPTMAAPRTHHPVRRRGSR